MGKDIVYTLKRGTDLTAEEISMIEAAREKTVVFDEDNPEIDPQKTPEQYAALLKAVEERNRRIAKKQT